MRIARLTPALLVPLLACGLALLGACGGGGGGGGATAPDPVVIPVPPPTTPPTTPPVDPPPTDPPPTDPPPTDPPPTDPPPTDPPPTDPPPTDPPPTPSVQPLPTPQGFDGYENVHGVAVDPDTDTVYAIRTDTAELVRQTSSDAQPQPVGATGLHTVRALAFDGPGNVLLAVTDGDTGNDDVLSAVNPVTAEVIELGTITGYDSIEALTYHGEGAVRKLYAVDTEQDVLLSLNPLSGLPTLVGPLGAAAGDVRALASVASYLVGVDATRGDVVTINPVGGNATQRVTLALGSLRGCAWSATRGKLRGVPADDKLYRVDLESRWIGWDQVKGLTYHPTQDALYGVHAGYGLVFRADVTTGWRQPLVQIQDVGLEGLACDDASAVLHVISRTSASLYRVQLDDGTVGPPTAVLGGSGPWRGLASLAFAQDKLYAIDATSGVVVQITPATGEASLFTSIVGHIGFQSLAYDATADRLLAYADGTRSLLRISRSQGAAASVVAAHDYSAIGGLAWLPDAGSLLGSDLATPELATLLLKPPTGLGYDEIHALSVNSVNGELTGFDVTTQQYLLVHPGTGVAEQRSLGTGLQVEGLAYDPHAMLTYGVDAVSHSLFSVDLDGVFASVGNAGALSAVDVRSLAFDPSTPPGVLYGYDNTTRKLVSIDLSTGAPTEVGDALTHESVEALVYMPDTSTFLGIDRSTRTLFEIDPATGIATDIVLLELTDVCGMSAVEGTEELLVIDTTLDTISVVDRFTGTLLGVFTQEALQRGSGDDVIARLLWPRGEVRAGHPTSLGIEVSIDYADDADLVLRDGKTILFKQRFKTDNAIAVLPFPAAARKALLAGSTLTWGLEFRDARKPIQVTCKQVPANSVRKGLAALAANAYLLKQKPHVIRTRTARVLLEGGLASEALIQAAHAATLAPDSIPAQRALILCGRALFGKQARDWRADALVQALGAADGPWELLGLPKPAAK